MGLLQLMLSHLSQLSYVFHMLVSSRRSCNLPCGSASLPFLFRWDFPRQRLPVHHTPLFHSPFLQVPEVISRIRQVSKSALKGDTKPKQEADEAFYNSQKYEVLYRGKVQVNTCQTMTFFKKNICIFCKAIQLICF